MHWIYTSSSQSHKPWRWAALKTYSITCTWFYSPAAGIGIEREKNPLICQHPFSSPLSLSFLPGYPGSQPSNRVHPIFSFFPLSPNLVDTISLLYLPPLANPFPINALNIWRSQPHIQVPGHPHSILNHSESTQKHAPLLARIQSQDSQQGECILPFLQIDSLIQVLLSTDFMLSQRCWSGENNPSCHHRGWLYILQSLYLRTPACQCSKQRCCPSCPTWVFCGMARNFKIKSHLFFSTLLVITVTK